MADRTHEADDIDKQYSQTKGLPLEIWHQIFWDASHIDNCEEFSTRPGAHNRLKWDYIDGEPGVAVLPPRALAEALETRRRITLVCKAWYSMAIHILYSHLRIEWCIWEEDVFSQLVTGCFHLIAHTRRLTVEIGRRVRTMNIGHVHKLAWLCSNLTRLQIMQAPGEILAIFADPALPEPLEVVIALESDEWYHVDVTSLVLRRFPDAWINIRVLSIHLGQLQLCLLEQPHSLTFSLLDDLRVYEVDSGDEIGNVEAIIYLGTTWTAPRLKRLTIIDITWFPWFKFFRRHSETLTTLCTFDFGEWRTSPRHSDDDEEIRLELPSLRAFYHGWHWHPPANLVANGVQRMGIHYMGFFGTMDLDESVRGDLKRLRSTFAAWSEYPNIKSCCISGWETAMERLEKEPEVIQFVDEMKEKGISVEFIRLVDGDLGF